MKDWLKQKYFWWAHLLWSIKIMLKHFLLLDEKGFMEAWYWTKIHLVYKSRRIK
jgi:hypothetical protein